MNQQTGELFKPEDMVPGSFCSVYNTHFEMLDWDEYTKKTFEDPNTVHRKFDLAVVMEKVREAMRQQFPLVRDIFRRFDTDRDGVLTHGEFKQMLGRYGFQQLSDEEVTIIMRHFDTRQDGQVSYNEFCDVLLDEDYTTGMLKPKPSLQQHIDPNYSERVAEKAADRAETSEVRRACRELGDAVYQRSSRTLEFLYRELQKMTHLPTVTNIQLRTALQSVGITFKLEDIDRVILYMYPDGDLKKVNYVNFFKSLIVSHHDFSFNR